MLNVAHVKNDVKWRPIVTKSGILISREYEDEAVWMININSGIGVLYVKRQILTYFGDVISLLAPVLIVSFFNYEGHFCFFELITTL